MKSAIQILIFLLLYGFTSAKMSSKLRKQLQNSEINYNGKIVKIDRIIEMIFICTFSGVIIYSYGRQAEEFQTSWNHFNLSVNVSYSFINTTFEKHPKSLILQHFHF